MSCPNPGQNLTTTVREQFIFKTIKKPGIHHAKQNGSRVTFNSVLHTRVTFKKKITSREHVKNLIICNHDSRIGKNSDHDPRGKKLAQAYFT